MLISEIEKKNATEEKKVAVYHCDISTVSECLSFSDMFDSLMILCVENEERWHGDEGVYIFRLSFI